MEKQVSIKRQWFIKSNTLKIDECYEIYSNKAIGTGSYGSVIKAFVKGTKIARAIKIIPKSRVKNPERFKMEIEIMKNLDHPNIIKLFQTFEDIRNVYLVMELCEGGEMFDRIVQQQHYSEKEAHTTFIQIVHAVNHCHASKICHRDLKPENFLYLDSTEESVLKVIDFGLSTAYEGQSGEKNQLTSQAGTPYYIAPEVLDGNYDEKCDCWSLGVILYVLLSGFPPFYGNTDDQIMKMVKKMQYSFNFPEWAKVSDQAKDLIKKLLVPANERLTAQQILEHPWMISNEVNTSSLGLNVSTLKTFSNNERFKKVALMCIASQCNEKDILELGKLFNTLDKNGDGILSIDEIKLNIKGLKNASEIEKIFNTIDTDGSGTVNYTEFITAVMDENLYLKQEKLMQAFKTFDLDGSGKISRQELRKILSQDEDHMVDDKVLEEMMKQVDANNDGEIDYQEFVLVMRKLHTAEK